MKDNEFEFNYVAPTSEERREIESIRNSYIAKTKQVSKLEQLRALDRKVKNIPMAITLSIGVVGLLIFGLGLTMILEWQIVLWGIVVSCVGVIPTIINYPIHLKIAQHLKNKYSKEILSLSEELLKNEK